jgi:hypothetical protein
MLRLGQHVAVFADTCFLKDPATFVCLLQAFKTELFSFIGERWSKRHLSYRIHKYSQKSLLSRAAVDEEMALAFAAWASVTDLVFRQVSEKADINISFFRGEHGDGTPFDGKGNMLGHANRPPGGMVHFDDDEPWTIRRDIGMKITVN